MTTSRDRALSQLDKSAHQNINYSQVEVHPGELLKAVAHRPFPMPENRPWVMAQSWQQLLFAHYRVAVDTIRPMIPPELEIDTYDGEAWISIVPFMMNHVHLRGIPSFPTTGKFPELNVRTYVKQGDKAGVWFFSLDAASFLAVWMARLTFNLPYFHATMSLHQSGDTIHYKSVRKHPGAKSAIFNASYRPIAPVQDYAPDSLDSWLSERYVLYSANRQGKVFIGHINHVPWKLQPAEADFQQDDMLKAAGIPVLDTEPLLHYAHSIDVITWAITPI